MKARDFFTAMPKLCGCPDAEREADIIGYIYDRELKGGSVWDRNDADRKDPSSRLFCAFHFEALDEGAKAQCWRLACLMNYAHLQEEHGEDHEEKRGNLWAEAAMAEPTYPEIAKVMTADEANAGHWAD